MTVEFKMMQNIFKFFGPFRPVLQARSNVCIQLQQSAGLKQSLEEKLGIPVRPKRPLTPFFRFMAQQRPVYAQKHPNMKMHEIAQIMAQQWDNVEESVRKQFEEDFKRDMAGYTAAVMKYEGGLTNEQREELQHAKEEILDSKNRRKLKKKMKELGKPRKPLSAFLLFIKSKAPEKKDESFAEWSKQMGLQWAALPEQQKTQYLGQFQQAMEVYRKELREWEERMIRLGNIDVVRNEVLIEPQPKLRPPRPRKPAT